MALWGGRFSKSPDQQAWNLNASIQFDYRLASQDIRGSMAWAEALEQAGVITESERSRIMGGLSEILKEFGNESFVLVESDEDIHTAVERRLEELIGSTAGKLHTGRSRNDQVVTDMRLWMIDNLPELGAKTKKLQATLVRRAESDLGVVMPGYTHLQRAQPILLSHWWLSYFWPLERDGDRLQQLINRCSVMPLGSAALAGTSFPVHRFALAKSLGFDSVSQNSLDAVSNRDFVAEFLFWASLTAVHLSKLAESIVLFTSAEFHFFELDDAYSTGSSLMPQKKNADVFELTRGKTGTLIGKLTGILSMLKGLPSTYDKDLQEDKLAIFETFDTLSLIMPVITGALETLIVYPEVMSKAVSPGMMATDLADYLVAKGIPFRKAHELVGEVVKEARKKDIAIDKLDLVTYQKISTKFSNDIYEVLKVENSLAHHAVYGGTSHTAVKKQMQEAKLRLRK